MRIMRTVLCAAALFVSGMNIDAVTTESDQSDMDINERVAHLLSKLTLEEKVGLVSGQSHGETKAVSRLGIRDLRVIDGPHGVGWGKKATSFPTGVSM